MSDVATPEEKASNLVNGVKMVLDLLNAIPIKEIAVAFRDAESEANTQYSRHIEEKKYLATLLREVADEMEAKVIQIKMARDEAQNTLDMAGLAIKIFNGSECKRATDEMEKFVGLLERLQRLRDSGLLTDIVNLSRQ